MDMDIKKTSVGGDARMEMRPPDQVPLTRTAAQRLGQLTGVEAESLVGRSVNELRKELEWIVDPNLFLYRKVCGRVVRPDPSSGDDWGVPGATVHVYDT